MHVLVLTQISLSLLVPSGTDRAESRSTNSRGSQSHWQAEPTDSNLVPIHLLAEFYSGNTEVKEEFWSVGGLIFHYELDEGTIIYYYYYYLSFH